MNSEVSPRVALGSLLCGFHPLIFDLQLKLFSSSLVKTGFVSCLYFLYMDTIKNKIPIVVLINRKVFLVCLHAILPTSQNKNPVSCGGAESACSFKGPLDNTKKLLKYKKKIGTENNTLK